MSPLAQYVAQYGSAGRLAVWLGVAALSAAGGAWLTHSIDSAAIERLRADAARQQATQAEHGSRRLLDAQTRGDELTTQLETANRAAMRLQENLDDAIRRATIGRPCLREPALRVLDGAHGLRIGVPAAASIADATNGAAPAASDELVSTDTDVALWIGRAGRQYDECRRRLDALIDWTEQGTDR